MDIIKIAAVVLIAAGILGLVQGGYTYTTRTHEARLGPIDMSVNEDRHVSIPLWASVGAIVLGSGLLLVRGRKN
jgi:uncharacterized iron-regulated membrane protein